MDDWPLFVPPRAPRSPRCHNATGNGEERDPSENEVPIPTYASTCNDPTTKRRRAYFDGRHPQLVKNSIALPGGEKYALMGWFLMTDSWVDLVLEGGSKKKVLIVRLERVDNPVGNPTPS